MNLYRLDIVPTGFTAPLYVDALAVRDILGPVLIRAAASARARAADAARDADRPVAVTRIRGAGALTHTLTIHPDGSAKRAPERSAR